MCEFCERKNSYDYSGKRLIAEVHDAGVFGELYPEVAITEGDKANGNLGHLGFYIGGIGVGISSSTKINFCPMCGRKLWEDE